MAHKIYTRKGDKGMTSLIGGSKVLKSDLRIEAYGTVDELNSYLGLCCDLITDESSKDMLKTIQDRLFIIGSSLAVGSKGSAMEIPHLAGTDVAVLEKEIDKMDLVLPQLKQFILPTGHTTVSHIHIARCICRRAERCCVRLQNERNEDLPVIITYLNRLSDYLFTLARYVGHLLRVNEIYWTGGK